MSGYTYEDVAKRAVDEVSFPIAYIEGRLKKKTKTFMGVFMIETEEQLEEDARANESEDFYAVDDLPPLDLMLTVRLQTRVEGDLSSNAPFGNKRDQRALRFLTKRGFSEDEAMGKWCALPERWLPEVREWAFEQYKERLGIPKGYSYA